MRVKLVKINLLNLFCVLAPLSVCGIVTRGIDLPICIIISIIALFLLLRNKMEWRREQRFLVILFFLPIFLSLLGVGVNVFLLNDSCYYRYIAENLSGRLVNVCCYLIMIVFAFSVINSFTVEELKKIMQVYLWSIIIVFVPFGIWQLLHLFFGIWIPPLDTRADLHSLTAYYGGIKRLTSLANEPSFLVPFLIDGIIIAAYLRKTLIVGIFIIFLLFSLSLGGYLNACIILLVGMFYLFPRMNFKKNLIIGVIISSGIFILFCDELVILFDIILSRRELSDGGIDISQSSRLQMVIMPWYFVVQKGIIPFIVGFGPGSFKYLHTTEKLANGDFFHRTSNCLYTDSFYEGGIVAILAICCFFIYMYFLLNKVRYTTNLRDVSFGKLLICQLVITSFYRADFMSPRFWIIVMLIFVFYRIAEFKFHENIANNPNL